MNQAFGAFWLDLFCKLSLIYLTYFIQVFKLFKTGILRGGSSETCAHLLDRYASKAFYCLV